jgi:hypothetical protein
MDYYLENFDCDAVDYHLALLIDAGLTKGTVSHGPGEVPLRVITTNLTWEGHEFLDAIRSQEVSNKTKDTLVEITKTGPLFKE